jgi:threonine/homoserine/homoserine lactone efflux protein
LACPSDKPLSRTWQREAGLHLTRIKARPEQRYDQTPGWKGNILTGTELALAILALLVTPGPTNSLMLLAGAERGMAAALRLIPAEVAGYLLTVVPLSLLGGALLADQPKLRIAVTLAAAIWVAVLAVRLWRVPLAGASGPGVGARDLLVTTALNPKALIFGLVLLPNPDRLGANLALFVLLVALVALFWSGLGAVLGGRGQPRAVLVLRRLASVFLGVMSLALAFRGVAA